MWYPLFFKPIFQERIWGGEKIKTLLGKSISEKLIGESWELSTVNGCVSEIVNGQFSGQSFLEVIQQFPHEILGEKVVETYGLDFPLLFKFLDAQDDLSIQLHPNDALAQKRHNSKGKTEMWYVLDAEEDARLIVGFNKNVTLQEYKEAVSNNVLVESLNQIPVNKGDVFYIPAGTVHAIGKGLVIAEIQQTSDVTYRIYDWDRVDENGVSRELHTEEALEAIDFNLKSESVTYAKIPNQLNTIVESPYFKTSYLNIDQSYIWENSKNEFAVFMVVEGSGQLLAAAVYDLVMGNTFLIPAAVKEVCFKGKLSLLEVRV